MSFSSELKTEIIEQPIKASCCRKAFALALIASKARVCDNLISLNVENDEHAVFASKYIADFFGATPIAERPKSGGRCRTLTFSSKSALRYLSAISADEQLYTPKCPACEAAFFKGMFFASGRISRNSCSILRFMEYRISSCPPFFLNFSFTFF